MTRLSAFATGAVLADLIARHGGPFLIDVLLILSAICVVATAAISSARWWSAD